MSKRGHAGPLANLAVGAYLGKMPLHERDAAMNKYVDELQTSAYAEGRQDERDDWLSRVGPLMRELWEMELLSEQQCAKYLDTDLVSCRRIIQDVPQTAGVPTETAQC